MSDFVKVFNFPVNRNWHEVEVNHSPRTGGKEILVNSRIVKREAPGLRQRLTTAIMGFKTTVDTFQIGGKSVSLKIERVSDTLQYSMTIDGVALNEYKKPFRMAYLAWEVNVNGFKSKVFMEKGSMKLWRKGQEIGQRVGEGAKFRIDNKEGTVEVQEFGNGSIYVLRFGGKLCDRCENWVDED